MWNWSLKRNISYYSYITLSSINIDNSNTGPFVIKKEANVKLILEGISKIIDKETNETLDDFEGAGIKFKSGSTLTISGTGTLIVLGNIKNGIKGASASNLIIESGTFNVTCVNNGIAADGSVIINGGIFNIETSEGDGIKSDPDYGDTDSEGSLTINDGTFNINSYNDGIQAKAKLIINGGTFNIKTFKDGSSATNFDKDLYSAKGIKVSTNETTDISMLISGGTFNLNTADDSLHSDGNLTITGGTFIISSGDDAVHADQYLILGKNGDNNNLIKLNISKSYEGLEGAQVYIYSGNIFKKALPDTNIIKCIIEIINGIKHVIIHIFNFLLSFLNLLCKIINTIKYIRKKTFKIKFNGLPEFNRCIITLNIYFTPHYTST